MLDVSAVERQFKDCLNLRVGLWGQGQSARFTHKRLNLSRPGNLNGVAAE